MTRPSSSIAILPFESLSEAPEDIRLARGFMQDLIAELARFPSVGVIAAESAYAVESKGLGDAGIGQHLAVGYLLKGSLRRAAGSLRLSIRLLQPESGELLWAERYDVAEEEIFSVQDDIAAKVANALTSRIDRAVLQSSHRQRVTSLGAYECWLRGMECLHRGTVEADDEARGFFNRALEIDPHYARAQAGLSLSHFNEWSCQAWECWEAKEKAAYECARQAEALDPDDAVVQVILAKIEQYRRQHGSAEARFRRALALSPNDAHVAIQLAAGFGLLGEPALGAEMGQRALALNPLCPPWWHYYAALPHFVCRDYGKAVELGQRSPPIITDGPAYLAAACALLGDRERAAAFREEFLKIYRERIAPGRHVEPDEPLRWLIHVNPYRREEDIGHFSEGLRMAGLAGAAPPSCSSPVSWPVGNVFRREGSMWLICFEHEVAHVAELRGFLDIAKLLAKPAEEVHCSELAGRPAGSRGAGMLDERARRAYRTRLQDIDAEISEADRANDAGRKERLEEEKEQLLDEIRKATGLGGRHRRLDDGAERARTAVTWRIRNAVKKLEPAHPAFARHLRHSIKTGVFCSYTPEKDTRWFV